MEYREAVPADLQGILDIYPQLSPENEGYSIEKAKATWAEIERNPYYKYYVAVESGIVVGTCNISVIPNLTRGCRPFAVVENVITDASHRNRGIGRRLMEMAVGFARNANCYKVLLLSSMKRKEAHLFYESIGFNGNSKKGFELRME